jgi:hypothetical protein
MDLRYFWKLFFRTRIRVKRWIQIRIKVKIHPGALEAQNGALEWRAMDAYNGGVEAQNGALEGL